MIEYIIGGYISTKVQLRQYNGCHRKARRQLGFFEENGVRRYQVSRATDDANYVLIDLEFDRLSQAEALLAAMREVWGRVEGTIMMNPQARIVEVVETKSY